jgi:hypothetical protein
MKSRPLQLVLDRLSSDIAALARVRTLSVLSTTSNDLGRFKLRPRFSPHSAGSSLIGRHIAAESRWLGVLRPRPLRPAHVPEPQSAAPRRNLAPPPPNLALQRPSLGPPRANLAPQRPNRAPSRARSVQPHQRANVCGSRHSRRESRPNRGRASRLQRPART